MTEKTLITSLEAATILGVQVSSLSPALRSCGMEPQGIKQVGGVRTFIWLRADVQQALKTRAERRALAAQRKEQALRKQQKPIDPLEGLIYGTLEAAKVLGWPENTLRRLEKAGVTPVRRGGNGNSSHAYYWLKTDIEGLKTRIDAGESVMPLPKWRSGAAESKIERVARVRGEFFERYGCLPCERPDLILEWCELLNQKAV